jgi:outer membrane lipoprotein SlyB
LVTTSKTFSCIAICAALLLGGCQSSKPVDDAAITTNVKAKLRAAFGQIEDHEISQLDRGANAQTITYIGVSSVNGVVTLTGEVRGKRARAKAEQLARGVPQVVRVNNNIALAPGYSDDSVDDKTQ